MSADADGRVRFSLHSDRVVWREGERFVKVFASRRARDAERERLRWLEAAGVAVPEVLPGGERELVTARLPGVALDQLVRERWSGMGRSERNEILRRVAGLCRRLRDAGLDWPDLTTYHVYVADDAVRVLDVARVRRGRLDLSPLYWSAEEPTVSRADRLRFWRCYAGRRRPPRLKRIGHRGRFRPYRWVFQRVPIFPVEPWSDFVTTLEVPYRSADELLQDPDLFVQRRLHGRLNAYLRRHRIHVKVFATARQARVEWENHRVLIGAGFLVPRPAVGGVLPDGRGLFSSVRLEGMSQLDRLMPQLDARRTILNVADLCRRLHACGLVHKDLYLCHFFGRPGSDLLGLIDLARVARTRSWRLRVKDLAAVVYSSREIGISWPTLYRGLRRYGGGRLLARAVMRKYRRMRSHVPRNVREGVETLEPPCT